MNVLIVGLIGTEQTFSAAPPFSLAGAGVIATESEADLGAAA